MNNQRIVERFSLIANLTHDEASSWADLCFECGAEIWSLKKVNTDNENADMILTSAAASLAFYRYCLYQNSCGKSSSFSVGDISVNEGSSNLNVDQAKKAWESARIAATPYLKDEGFAFKQVKS